jgi:hypothetical protein
MSTNGILDFQNTNKVIFRGTDSNVVVDTSNASIGIGIQGTEKPGSNLHVIGDASISSNLKLTTDTSILVNSNVVADFNGPHARLPKEVPLKKYPEIAFAEGKFDANESTNTYVQAGYTVTASSQSSGAEVWRLFDDGYGAGSYWNQENVTKYPSPAYTYSPLSNSQSLGDVSGEWFKLELPQKIIVNKIEINAGNNVNYAPLDFKIIGSNNDTDWTVVKDVNGLTTSSYSSAAPFTTTIESVSSAAYKYYAIVFTRLYAATQVSLHEIKFYGYEEDPPVGDSSLDTTFKSVLNTPQTTGANVYVDAKLSSDFTNQVTGPAGVGSAVTHDNTNKYWEMNGQLTSNITVEANTFLEGDQPHAVSMWFNSSNLEANVSNTCVFSISDQEHLNSQNLDLQSNTWHNLTYAYQGEGGSRVTYLDGRKVAEDQAEDTFGDYPPFAMTGYSQGGYVVSANAEESDGRAVWKLFDNTGNTTAWRSVANGYYNADGTYGGSANLGSDSGGTAFADADKGDWVKIELPYKFKLNYFTLQVRNSPTFPGGSSLSFGRSEFIKNGKVWGSNDGISWSLVHTISGTSASSDTATNSYTVTSSIAYKYFGLVVTDTNTTTAGLGTSLSEIELYGHRENDLVRLPDPTNVLKYPHIAMTGPAQRGYVASASSNYNNLDRYAGWNAFNETVDDPDGWVSYPGSYSSGTPSTYSGVTQPDKLTGIDATSSGGDTSRNGSWLKIEVPHKLRLSQMKLFRRHVDQRIVDGFIYGSNDNSTFYQISNNLSQITNIGTYSNTTPLVINSTDTTTPFKQFVVQVTENTTIVSYTNIGNIELYGTEEATPVPIQIGGGNIDKVANFRVYDKFIDENQALEIWDAQKDEFRGVKNSVTLHKGRLGIGTTEPEGRLAVLDEPHNLEEFPPRAMTAEETYMEGHGVFKAFKPENVAGYEPHRAFDKNPGILWAHDGSPYDTNGNYVGGSNGLRPITFKPVNGTGTFPSGEWVGIELPYKIKPDHFIITSRDGGQHLEEFPRKFSVYATSDGYTWVLLKAFDNIDSPGQAAKTAPLLIRSNETYKSFVWIWEKIQGSAANGGSGNQEITLSNISLFGTREQGQSVLHDGQLTLTKNLNVPRIGPALDADDTPRRDRLVVEYNTSTNPTFEGAVRDTSGRGNDGVFYGGASYDANEKALVFDGGDQHIITNMNNKGDTDVSISFWIKRTADTDPVQTVVTIGTIAAGKSLAFDIYDDGAHIFWWTQSGDNIVDVDGASQFPVGTWVHVTGTRTGRTAGYKLYINGVDWTPNMTQTTGANALTLSDNAQVTIGSRNDGTTYNTEGNISNFKLYDTALTASEVKTLYDMGRCDEGHHVVNFSKTRVGIGLGDGEAPRSALDVRDLIYAESSTVQTFTGQHKCVPEEPVEKGLIVSASQNKL